MKILKSAKGFSLIELIIVVAIIGILSSIAISSYQKYKISAQKNSAKANLSAYYSLQKSFFLEEDVYCGGPRSGSDSITAACMTVSGVDGSLNNFTILGFSPEGELDFRMGVSVYSTNQYCGAGKPCREKDSASSNGLAALDHCIVTDTSFKFGAVAKINGVRYPLTMDQNRMLTSQPEVPASKPCL